MIKSCRKKIARSSLRSQILIINNRLLPKISIFKCQGKLFIERKVESFFEENRRTCPGKKDVITRNKIKNQNMYLNDNIVMCSSTIIEHKNESVVKQLVCCSRCEFS